MTNNFWTFKCFYAFSNFEAELLIWIEKESIFSRLLFPPFSDYTFLFWNVITLRLKHMINIINAIYYFIDVDVGESGA